MESNKLKELDITYSDITDDACDVITTALQRNSCLSMYGNLLSNEAIISIVRCLEVNDTLQLLGLPNCSQAIQENIKPLQQVLKKRKSRGCQVKLEIKFTQCLL